MNRLESYINGAWVAGSGAGTTMYDAVTGDPIGISTTQGLDIPAALAYGRTEGTKILSKMTFQQRGQLLKKLALYLTKRKEQFYELSYRTGATRMDSWIDIEGGFGNLFAYASLRKVLPNQPFHIDGAAVDLSKGGQFMAQHILVPKRGVAVHINAFNFPIWGMLEKCAVNWMAGVPAVVLPAPQTAYLTEAVVRVIVASGIIPEGALQLLSGKTPSILETLTSQDVVTFTGSAATGRVLKAHPRLIEAAVPFTMEADSLNACVLGSDAAPGTPEFTLFIKEVCREMTVKAGQKCTAIRRAIVPASLMEAVQTALAARLDNIKIGDPRHQEVRMGALASQQQLTSFKANVAQIAQTAEIVYGQLDTVSLVGTAIQKGAFVSPIVIRQDAPMQYTAAHEIEAFGPATTLMPYSDIEEAITLSQLGKGSLVASICTYDDQIAKDFVFGAASHHGRVLVLNRENATQSTGHGSPLPLLTHGGPGRAGGGEEMGGIRGIHHYMQRCAVQGTSTTLTNITGVYQANARYTEVTQHPFAYHWEDLSIGMSLKTHKRTITDTDIINFGNLTWDHFYAHTDISSLDGSIFEKRTAHGYFILAAAAGLFVYPNKGPVTANYGLEECRFLRPIYHNDTVYVRLTCKQKIDRDTTTAAHPSGIVKWFVEVFDTEDELVAVATILTMVQKKQTTFVEMTDTTITHYLERLTDTTPAQWGIMTPQHMVEHLAHTYQIAAGIQQDFDIATPADALEKVKASLYDYNPFPVETHFPLLPKNRVQPLQHPDLATAIAKFQAARRAYLTFFKEHPTAEVKNVVFGMLNKYEWYLLERKHLNHHFHQFGLIEDNPQTV